MIFSSNCSEMSCWPDLGPKRLLSTHREEPRARTNWASGLGPKGRATVD